MVWSITLRYSKLLYYGIVKLYSIHKLISIMIFHYSTVLIILALIPAGIFVDAKSNKCNDFCCKSALNSKFCELIRKVGINNGHHHDIMNDEVDVSNPDCKKCLFGNRGASSNLKSENDDSDESSILKFDLQHILKKIDCKNNGKCQSKQNTQRHHHQYKKHSKTLIGNNKCVWGPRVVCNSLETASKCNHLLTCADKWIKYRLQPINNRHDDQCLNCQKLLSNIHYKGEPLKSIVSSVLSNNDLKSTYLTYFTELIALRNLSNGGVSPAVLCNLMNQCNGNLVDYKPDDLECVLGHSIWIRARRLLHKNKDNSRSFADIRDQLLHECGNEYRCEQAVLYFLPTMMSTYINYISNDHDMEYTAEEPCVYLGACSPSTSSSVWCDMCLTTIYTTKKMLVNNGSVEFARKSMKLICKMLGPRQAECEDYIDRHVEQWMEDVEVNVNASKICSDIKLCEYEHVQAYEQSIADVEGSVCEKCEAIINTLRKRATCRVKKFFNFVIPSFCRFLGPLQDRCLLFAFSVKDELVTLIESILKADLICKKVCKNDEQATLQYAKQKLLNDLINKVCDSVGKKGHELLSAESESCQTFSTQLITVIADWLLADNFNDPNDECDADSMNDDNLSNCDICQMFQPEDIAMIMWNNGDNLDKVIEEMINLCPSLATHPDKHKQCVHFIGEFTMEIKRVLPELGKPNQYDQLCYRIKACQSYDDNCMVCTILSKQLKELLPPDDITENTTTSALDAICQQDLAIPVETCNRFIDNFKMSIVALIVNHQVKPNSLCRNLGVCYIDQDKGKLTMNTCEICRFAVEAIERALATNSSEEQIANWVELACKRLPDTYHKKCSDFVKENLHKIIEFLDLLVQPELVCSKLGLCYVFDDLKNVKSSKIPQNPQYSMCTLCQMFDIVLKGWLQSSQTIERLAKLLKLSCEHLFTDEERKIDCKEAIESMERILTYFVKNHDSIKLCTLTQFCPSTNATISNSRVKAAMFN
ncbi:hypothetical protein GJ496_001888 [Pomphorhynchus laevis]|nr:hypothetical protein GJ496_001888 [Pomphorhynchus laevis]